MGKHSAPRRSRRRLLAVSAGFAAFSVFGAFAATLGGITSKNLGADTQVVAACDTDGVAVAFNTAYTPANDRYEVTSVDVSGIAAGCAGQTIKVTLAGGGVDLTQHNQVVAGATENVAFNPTPAANAVTSVAIVITG